MKLELLWHLGVGDAIVCRALFRHFISKVRPTEVCVPATTATEDTVRELFTWDAPHGVGVQVRVVGGSEELHRKPYWDVSFRVTVGAACPKFVYPRWDWSFYDQCGVDPAERFRVWQDMNDLPPNVWDEKRNQRAFLLRQRRRGRKLAVFHETREKRIPNAVRMQYAGRLDWKVVNVSPELGPSLLSWIPVLVDAEAIHMVDSGPCNLANSLPLKPGCNFVIYGQRTPPPSMLNPNTNPQLVYGTWKP